MIYYINIVIIIMFSTGDFSVDIITIGDFMQYIAKYLGLVIIQIELLTSNEQGLLDTLLVFFNIVIFQQPFYVLDIIVTIVK